MRTVIIMFILGLTLGFQGCTQKEKTMEDDQEIIIDDNAENVQEDDAKKGEEKHLDNPADIMEDLIF